MPDRSSDVLAKPWVQFSHQKLPLKTLSCWLRRSLRSNIIIQTCNCNFKRNLKVKYLKSALSCNVRYHCTTDRQTMPNDHVTIVCVSSDFNGSSAYRFIILLPKMLCTIAISNQKIGHRLKYHISYNNAWFAHWKCSKHIFHVKIVQMHFRFAR